MSGAQALFGAQAAMALGSAFLGSRGDVADYNKRINAINQEGEALTKSLIFKYQMGQLQQQQIENRQVLEAGEKTKALRDSTGTAEAAAASSGIEGPSLDALITGFNVSTGQDISNINLQADNEMTQSRVEMRGQQMETINRIRSLQNQIPDDPSTKIMARFLNAGFQTAGAFIQNTTATKDGGLFGRRFG
jgi:hypothetical protein